MHLSGTEMKGRFISQASGIHVHVRERCKSTLLYTAKQYHISSKCVGEWAMVNGESFASIMFS